METCGTARVIRAQGRRAEVEIDRTSACGSCHSSDLCGAFSGRSNLRAEVDNPLGARAGQLVEISAGRAVGLKAAFMVYMLPAMFFVAGVIVGAEVLRWPPWASGLLGVGMLGISWLIAWRYDRRARTRAEFRMSITRILAPVAEDDEA